ncbi:MAG TPA: ribose-5-phosphate isomerase RpiA [Gammaproteobacteria bacterium]|nr:ribose-5-phosphate isomerase RpiA [Gammaproteobacteria bacterium]
MSNDLYAMKLSAAKATLEYISEDQIIGVGTGSTVNIFIEQLATVKNKIAGAVASSESTASALKAHGIPVVDFNSVDVLPLYVDGADAYNTLKQLIKGGGGALTREKILAYASKKFVCIVDASKKPSVLGESAVPVEVIPMARSLVARELVKLGGQPQYRNNFTTDNGNIILDVFGLQITQPIELEHKIKQIIGVVESGIFATRSADVILVGEATAVKKI